jgi:hypothetical protein
LPEHCEVPAVQEPEHCVPVHAPLAQACAVPQVPFAPQVSRPLPMHWTAPGEQVPPQAAVPVVTMHA